MLLFVVVFVLLLLLLLLKLSGFLLSFCVCFIFQLSAAAKGYVQRESRSIPSAKDADSRCGTRRFAFILFFSSRPGVTCTDLCEGQKMRHELALFLKKHTIETFDIGHAPLDFPEPVH